MHLPFVPRVSKPDRCGRLGCPAAGRGRAPFPIELQGAVAHGSGSGSPPAPAGSPRWPPPGLVTGRPALRVWLPGSPEQSPGIRGRRSSGGGGVQRIGSLQGDQFVPSVEGGFHLHLADQLKGSPPSTLVRAQPGGALTSSAQPRICPSRAPSSHWEAQPGHRFCVVRRRAPQQAALPPAGSR